MDDPLPFPPPPDEPVPGLCSQCGLLTDLEALNERLSSTISSKLSAIVDKFLSCNHPLPSETREEIASSLEPSTTLLGTVDEAVSQLSKLLDSLQATRDSLADRVQRSRFVLHPLRTLPAECLSNVFSHCITHVEGQDDDLLFGIPPQLLANDPWTLSRISRHWRDVAVNTPKIWSNVVIIIYEAAEQAYWEPYCLSSLNLLLTRSAAYPLNVVIHSMYDFSMNHPLLQGVMAHCQRWRRLYLNIRFTTFTFLQQIYHNLPVLEHLFFEFWGTDYNSALSQISEQIAPEWDNFNLATNLRSICILPRIIQDTFGYCPQFANRIKKYRTVFCGPDRLYDPPFPFIPRIHLQDLRKLPNLEDWTAMCWFDDEWPSATDNMEFEEERGIVVMNALRSIRIKEKEEYWGAIAQVLDHMSVPSLSELVLEGDLDEDCISSVIDFIDRSHCAHKIQTLTLIDAGHNHGATPFIPLLSKLPCLIELGLQYTSLPPPPPPPPLLAQINLMDDEVDLLSLAEKVLPKGLEILVLSDEIGLDVSILDGVSDARPRLKVRKVDKLEIK
jgi:hypothetical protein